MKELILKYRNTDQYNYSCSEAIIIAANEYYNLGLTEDAFKMMAPFSGGMLEQETCGVVTGAIAVLGIVFTEEYARTSDKMKDAVLEYKAEFNKRFSSRDCSALKELPMQQESCTDLVVEGALLLEEIINKYGK